MVSKMPEGVYYHSVSGLLCSLALITNETPSYKIGPKALEGGRKDKH